ncbi:TonB-dependent siderophore receptor [Piscinibacter sp.]|uniref:TonB-dependent siderophore receptor n=1 Tax=Piscinibacter sp. TaxID=1903157 RepID=UPI0039E3D028
MVKASNSTTRNRKRPTMDHRRRGASRRLFSNALVRSAMACAMGHTLFGSLGAAVTLVTPFTAWAQAAPLPIRSYSIPPGTLEEALTHFGRAAGILLSFTPESTAGLRSPGLQGSYSVQGGLDALLAGSGLRAAQQANGTFVLSKEFAAAAASSAAPQAREATLPAVRVMAQTVLDAVTTEGTGSYTAQGATLMKSTHALKDIPQSVSVITRQQMDDQRLDTLYDVLANTPGVTLVNRPNGGRDVYSRGFATSTFQYDGVPLQRGASTGNHFAASSIYLDRVEVLRGAQGLLEGAGNPAGAVNLVRKRGLAKTGVKVEGRAGSWDNLGARVEAGGPLDGEGRLRSRVALDYEDKDYFVDTMHERNLNAYAALDVDLTPQTALGLGLAHSRLEGTRFTYYGVPRYADGRALNIPRSAFIGADWNNGDRHETQAFIDFEHRFDPNWKLKLAGVYIEESLESIMSFGGYMLVPVDGSTIGGHGYTYDIRTKNLGVDAALSGRLQALGLDHEVVLGTNYSRQRQNYAYDEYWEYTAYNVFDPNHDAPRFDGIAPNGIYRFAGRETQKGIYGTLRSHLTDTLTLSLGVRASWYEAPSQTRTMTRTSTNLRKESGEITPYAGLVYALTPEWSVYASYADIFQPQSATNAQLEVLPPIVGANHEVGIKGELFDGALNTSFAVFRIDQSNRAIADFDSPPVCGSAGTSRCSRAAGKVRSEGLELEVRGQLAKDWQLGGGYTYNRNEFLQDANAAQVGKPFDYNTPKHIFRLWADHKLPGQLGQWSIGAGVDYRSEQKTNSTTRLNPVQGGYSIWNARVSYQINKIWAAALNVENLFDKKYYTFIATDYVFSFVGEPRNALLTLRGQF